MPIRSAAKAIIIQDDKILCIRYRDARGIHYGLPGGGQDFQEDLRETVVRECKEEIDCVVEAGDLLFVREFIGARHAVLKRHRHMHQVDHFFACTLAPDSVPRNGIGQDNIQEGVEWLSLDHLTKVKFIPSTLVPHLRGMEDKQGPIYLEAGE